MIKKTVLAILIITVMITGCSKNSGEEDAEYDQSKKIKVFTSILPQKYFVERIGGDRVSVDVLVLPGKSPATYEPTPSQVIALSSADLFFNIGVPFEKSFIGTISDSLNGLDIRDVSAGIKKRQITDHFHDEHDPHSADEHEEELDELHADEHGEEHDDLLEDEHEDGHSEGNDPHIWLSTRLAEKMSENIFIALSEKDPDNREFYSQNFKDLSAELDETGRTLKEMLNPYKGKRFFVFHPSFGYFADEYGLEQIAVESGGKEPSPASLERIISKAKSEKIKIIIAQPEFSKKSAEVIADAINGEVLLLNPLDSDYFNTLSKIAEGIISAFEN